MWWANVFDVDKQSCLEDISFLFRPPSSLDITDEDMMYDRASSFVALDAVLTSNANLCSLRIVNMECHGIGAYPDWNKDTVSAYTPRLLERGILHVEYVRKPE